MGVKAVKKNSFFRLMKEVDHKLRVLEFCKLDPVKSKSVHIGGRKTREEKPCSEELNLLFTCWKSNAVDSPVCEKFDKELKKCTELEHDSTKPRDLEFQYYLNRLRIAN